MSFLDSSPVSIPLSDPKIRYGNTFSVSDIYLVSSAQGQFYRNAPPGSENTSVFKQDFSDQFLSFRWNVTDPGNGFVYTSDNGVINNQYISGFDIEIYQNNEELDGLNVITGRHKVFEKKGVVGNQFSYQITGAKTGRNYSIDVRLTDFTGNQSSGILTSKNPEAQFSAEATGIVTGYFQLNYSGYTDSLGNSTSNGLAGVDLYNYTGLTSGASGFFSQESGYFNKYERVGSGFNGFAQVELSPGLDNYVMMIARDQYNTGSVSGFFQRQVYATGSGFSGLSGNLEAPLLVDYPITIAPTTGYRISGGEALYYSFAADYNTGSSLMYTCYGITGTGITTGSVSGYNGSIFLDSGVLYDTSYNEYNTGYQYVYDNSLSLQSGFYTGIKVDKQLYTGSGITGSGTIGSGAGSYWKSDSPKYTGTISGSMTGGQYNYAYFDSSDNRIGCVSTVEVSGGVAPIEGIYSMPKDDPNSYNIKYREGNNFSKSYEQASAYLNSLGEMPAVIVNNSQWERIKSINTGVGWVGLRRNKVSLLSGLFREDFKNQEYFLNTEFGTAQTSGFQTINATGGIEANKLYVNDVGAHWAWVNGSGNHIYKYAGSGYEKVRTSEISIDVKRNSDNYVITGIKISADAPKPELENLTTGYTGLLVQFNYNLKNVYYSASQNSSVSEGSLFYKNYDIMKIALYTGSGSSFEINENNLFSINSPTSAVSGVSGLIRYQSAVDYPIGLNQSQPNYFKLAPYDSISSGIIAETGFAIYPEVASQSIAHSLDPQFDASSTVVDVAFPILSSSSSPKITQTVAYTGTLGVSYLGSMVGTAPTQSGASFILTSAPPATGYALYIEVN